ncbi:MAG: hypothetical protein V1827_03740 [Candidatus Micrarchaeota archaeon]
MKALTIFLCAAILLAGCTDGGSPPADNQSNQTPVKNDTPAVIIIKNQTNQTIEKNETDGFEPPPPPPQNDTGFGYTYDPDQMLGVFLIDVGGPGLQGDAVLIKKGDLDILVDAGPKEKSAKVVDFLRAHSVDDIEVLVSTNADPRRFGGIGEVASVFAIEEFWWSGDDFDDPDYIAAVQKASEDAETVRIVEEGYGADLGGINLTVLNPPSGDRFDDFNNDAVVIRFVDRGFSMLLTSGIQTGAQGLLLNQHEDQLIADVLQAPYYGVGMGTSAIGVFLINAKPETVVISGSSDESAANGGSRDPFKRLMEQYGIRYYENYVNGSLRITSNGETYTVQALGKGQ